MCTQMHNNQHQRSQLYSNLIQNHITILNDRPKKVPLTFIFQHRKWDQEGNGYFCCTSAVPHLCNALLVRRTSTARCVYRYEHTLLPHPYKSGQLYANHQTTNKVCRYSECQQTKRSGKPQSKQHNPVSIKPYCMCWSSISRSFEVDRP